MSPLTETVLLVFGLIALGYLAGLTGYLNTLVGDGMTGFAVRVAMPLLLFRTMVNADFSGATPWSLWGAYFSSVVVAWASGHFITTLAFGREPAAGVVGGVSAAFSNLVLLGIPLIIGAFGHDGFEILSLLLSVHLPVMIFASIIQFRLFSIGETTSGLSGVARQFSVQMLSNPLIIGILCGLLWRLTGLALPTLAVRLVDALAGVAGTVALFAMGLGLRKFGVTGNILPGVALAAIKLLLMPAVALAAVWLIGLPPLAAKVVVTAAALPAGINSYLIATQFGTGQALASNAMTVATAFAVITIAFWLTIATMIFG